MNPVAAARSELSSPHTIVRRVPTKCMKCSTKLVAGHLWLSRVVRVQGTVIVNVCQIGTLDEMVESLFTVSEKLYTLNNEQ